MLNRFNLLSLFYIAILVLLQVYIFNQFNFFSKYNPLIYIIFILFYPLQRSKYILLIYSFILGFGIDLLTGTPGINAFSCVLIAYLRTYFLSWTTRSNAEFFNFKFEDITFLELFQYLLLMTFTHHLSLYSLDYFKIENYIEIIKDTIINTIITMIFISLIYSLILRRTSI